MNRLHRKPLAEQLKEQIWEMLEEEHAQPGDQLPTEQVLLARFGVSRVTVREALKILEDQHLIICRHGIGRFVAHGVDGVLFEDITKLKSVTEMARDMGVDIETRVLSVSEKLPTEREQSRLDLSPNSRVVMIERVRLAQGAIVIYSQDVLPRTLITGNLEEIDFRRSLLSIMESEWNTYLAYSKAVISAVSLGEDLSHKMSVPSQEAWILLEQTNYDESDRPLLYSLDYHRGDKFQFHVLRRRK